MNMKTISSKDAPASKLTILDACEVLEATDKAAESIREAPVHKP